MHDTHRRQKKYEHARSKEWKAPGVVIKDMASRCSTINSIWGCKLDQLPFQIGRLTWSLSENDFEEREIGFAGGGQIGFGNRTGVEPEGLKPEA